VAFAAGAENLLVGRGWNTYGAHAAIIVRSDGSRQVITGNAEESPENRETLKAIIAVLEATPVDAVVLVDVSGGIEVATALERGWVPGWRSRGWATTSARRVEDADLWERFDDLLKGRWVKWGRTQAHAAVTLEQSARLIASREKCRAENEAMEARERRWRGGRTHSAERQTAESPPPPRGHGSATLAVQRPSGEVLRKLSEEELDQRVAAINEARKREASELSVPRAFAAGRANDAVLPPDPAVDFKGPCGGAEESVVVVSRALAFTDGACLGNFGACPGGWAAIVVGDDGQERIISGRDHATTNNVMELTAAIRVLEAVPPEVPVTIVTDSQYVAKGFVEWLPQWKARGWRTAGKKPVLNVELWRRLEGLAAGRQVSFRWVRGHAGDPMNERADALANAEAEKAAAESGWTPARRHGFGTTQGDVPEDAQNREGSLLP
jgi:ribonuclease HI